MSKFSREILKMYFLRGKYPTEEQFSNLIDSVVHQDDKININKVNGLTEAISDKAEKSSLDAHCADKANPHAVTAAQVGLGAVDNTADIDKPISTATQTALDGKYGLADGTALEAAVESHSTNTEIHVSPIDKEVWNNHATSKANPHTVTAAQVGLGAVDNTADVNKPISTATQAALDTKTDNEEFGVLCDSFISHNTSKSNPHYVTASQVGLGAVDNTADVNKPISTATQAALNEKETPAGSQAKASNALATAKAYADDLIGRLVDSSPAALDTLQELATALGNDPNFATTIATQIGLKADKIRASSSADGLMSFDDKIKLDGIAIGANKYTHPSSHPATMITEDANHRYATDAEKTRWDAAMQPNDLAAWAKQPSKPSYTAAEVGAAGSGHSHTNASQTVSGFMSHNDKAKLDGIAAGANKYTHPSSHPATMITEDANHRYATDAEKTRWDAAMQPNDLAAWAKQPSKPSYTAAEVGAASSSHSHNGLNRVKRTNLITFTNARPDASMYPYSPGSTTSYLYTANSGVSFGIILPNATNHFTPFDAKSFPAGAVVEVSVTNYEGCYVWTYLQIK